MTNKPKGASIASAVVQILNLFERSMKQLGYEVQNEKLENLSILVFNSMTQQNRAYHSPTHIFEMVDTKFPIGTLATLFHDVVYLQVDREIPVFQKEWIKPFEIDDKFQVQLPELSSVPDEARRNIELLYMIYGVTPGQVLGPFTGINEFLSGWIAVQCLYKQISPWNLVEILMCIEMSIPFRKQNAEGKYPAELLFERIKAMTDFLGFQKTDQEIENAVSASLEVSYKDIGGFAAEDLSTFLANTWNILIESNPCLKSPSYTIEQYRLALFKSESFYSSLDEKTIYQPFRNHVSDKKLAGLHKKAKENLSLICQYLRAKLLPIAILEALAKYSGGDVPLSFFMGETPTLENPNPIRLEAFLPELQLKVNSHCLDATVYQLLKSGRAGSCTYDLKNSPLANFVYEWLGEENTNHFYKHAKSYFSQEITNEEFLAFIPRELLTVIIEALEKVVYTRTGKFESLKSIRKLELVEKKIA